MFPFPGGAPHDGIDQSDGAGALSSLLAARISLSCRSSPLGPALDSRGTAPRRTYPARRRQSDTLLGGHSEPEVHHRPANVNVDLWRRCRLDDGEKYSAPDMGYVIFLIGSAAGCRTYVSPHAVLELQLFAGRLDGSCHSLSQCSLYCCTVPQYTEAVRHSMCAAAGAPALPAPPARPRRSTRFTATGDSHCNMNAGLKYEPGNESVSGLAPGDQFIMPD